MSFVLGALGAVAVFGLFALGVLAGWKLRGRFVRPVAPAPDKELQRMAAEQDAFRQMQQYNADVAYGIGQKDLGEDETG
jgi:hypothetical protein